MRPIAAFLSLSFLTLFTQAQEDRTEYFKSIHLAKSETAGDVVCFLCSVDIAGTATGDVVAICGDVTVSGVVGGDVVASGGRVLLLPGSVTKQDVVAVGGMVDKRGAASGDVESIRYIHLPGQRSFDLFGAGLLVVCSFLLILIGGLILRRRRAEDIVDRIRRRWWLHLAIGAAAWVAYLIILEDIEPHSILGEVFWYLLASMIAFLMFLGYLGLAWLVGHTIFGREGVIAWITGAVVLTALLLIPLAGALVALLYLAITWGTGCEFVVAWILRRLSAFRRDRGPAAAD